MSPRCVLCALLLVGCSDDRVDIYQPAGDGGLGGGGDGGAGGAGVGGTGPGGGGAGGGGEGGEGGVGGGGGSGGAGAATAPAPAPDWAAVHGGTGAITPQDVAIDANGGIVVVGSLSGSADLGGGDLVATGGTDVFIAKYDSAGTHQWSYRVGDGADQAALSVAIDSAGAIWVSGTTEGAWSFPGGGQLDAAGNMFPDAWLAKLEPDGDHLGSACYGLDVNGTDIGRAVATGPSDQAAFAGTFQGSIDFGGTQLTSSTGSDYSMFLVRYSGAAFTPTLVKAFGGAAREDAFAVAYGIDGSIAIAGAAEGDIDFGGGVLVHPGGGRRAVVAKLDAGGAQLFAHLFASAEEAEVTGAAFSATGELFLTGSFSGSIDLGAGPINAAGPAKEIFVARFDANGALVYGERFGGNSLEEPRAIGVDSSLFATITGRMTGGFVVNPETTLGFAASSNDAFLVRIAPPGYGYWGRGLGATIDARGRSVAIDPGDDGVVIVGDFSGPIDLGAGPIGAGASQDMFIARYAKR